MHAEFECPECGGRKIGAEMRVSPKYREGDPWSKVFHRLECFRCGACVPVHLGLRSEGFSGENAILEWKSRYRPWPQSQCKIL